MKFSKWSVVGGVSYTVANLDYVSCDMDLVAEFAKQWYITFKYKNYDTSRQLCQITCDDGSDLT